MGGALCVGGASDRPTWPLLFIRFDLTFCFQDHEHATFDDILGEFELSVIPNMMMPVKQEKRIRLQWDGVSTATA